MRCELCIEPLQTATELERAGPAGAHMPVCDACHALADRVAGRLRRQRSPLTTEHLTRGLGGFVTLVRLLHRDRGEQHSDGPALLSQRLQPRPPTRFYLLSPDLVRGLTFFGALAHAVDRLVVGRGTHADLVALRKAVDHAPVLMPALREKLNELLAPPTED